MTIRSYQLQVQALITPGTGSEISRSAISNLDLTQEGEAGAIYIPVEDSLNLSQSVFEALHIADRIPVEHELNLDQEVSVDGQESESQDLSLTQSASFIGPIPKQLTQNLNLTQQATVIKSGLPWTGFHVGHWVLLNSAAGFPLEVDAEDDLNLEDFGTPWNGSHDLGLDQDVSGGRGFDAEDDLDLEAEVELDAEYNPDGSQPLGVTDAVAYYIESRCGRSNRNDFHGSGGVAPTPEPLKYQSKLTLYSAHDVDDSITLRNPETDNRYRVAYQRVNRQLFDGSPDVFSDPNWVDEFDQLYTIVALKRETLDSLLEFLLNHLGEDIIVRDWEGVSWNSIVTNVSEVHTEDAEGYWTIELQLRSTRIGGEILPHDLRLESTASGVVDRPVSASSVLDMDEDTGYTKDWGLSEDDDLSLTSEATYVLET